MLNRKKQSKVRQIDIIAKEKYNGDTHAALNDMMENEQCIDDYVDELTKDEAEIVFSNLLDRAIERHGGKEAFNRKVILGMKLERIGLTEEYVKSTDKNPFTHSAIINLLVLLGGEILLILLIVFKVFALDLLAGIESMFIGIMSLAISSSLIKSIRFKRIKKEIDNFYETEK